MPINWSEIRGPNKACHYNHVVAESPIGELRIEWKGWKDYDSPTCMLPWGEFVLGNDLAEAKENVRAALKTIAIKVAELVST